MSSIPNTKEKKFKNKKTKQIRMNLVCTHELHGQKVEEFRSSSTQRKITCLEKVPRNWHPREILAAKEKEPPEVMAVLLVWTWVVLYEGTHVEMLRKLCNLGLNTEMGGSYTPILKNTKRKQSSNYQE